MGSEGRAAVDVDFKSRKRAPIEGSIALKIDGAEIDSPRRPLHPVTASLNRKVFSPFANNLSEARRQYVTEQQGRKKEVKAYEVEQDVVVYRVLKQQEGSSEYDSDKESLDAYTKMQLETHLGERLHVGISQLHHTIVNGEMRVADTDESLLEMLKRGRDYRRIHGKPVDWDREEAEVLGFERIQKELTKPDAPIGTMMFFVSPQGDIEKGSIYKNNFYDIHHKVSDTEVVSFRFTSGLTPEESQQRLKLVDSRYDRGEIPTDAEFIANPIKVLPGTKGLENPDTIHSFMHVDHKYMSRKKFAVVLSACQPLINDYRQSLTDDPDNIAEHKKRLDILMNYADNVAEELESASGSRVVALSDYQDQKDVRPWIPPQIDRDALSRQKVRVAATGCGSSGGASGSKFSVAEAGQSSYTGENAKNDPNLCRCAQGDGPHFHCPGKGGTCDNAITVGEGTSSCPKCGTGQVC